MPLLKLLRHINVNVKHLFPDLCRSSSKAQPKVLLRQKYTTKTNITFVRTNALDVFIHHTIEWS